MVHPLVRWFLSDCGWIFEAVEEKILCAHRIHPRFPLLCSSFSSRWDEFGQNRRGSESTAAPRRGPRISFTENLKQQQRHFRELKQRVFGHWLGRYSARMLVTTRLFLLRAKGLQFWPSWGEFYDEQLGTSRPYNSVGNGLHFSRAVSPRACLHSPQWRFISVCSGAAWVTQATQTHICIRLGLSTSAPRCQRKRETVGFFFFTPRFLLTALAEQLARLRALSGENVHNSLARCQ